DLALQGGGLRLLHVQIVDDDQIAAFGLGRERHLQAERADLLVQRRIEVADPRAVRLAAADEDRSAAIAVTGGAATLLPAVFLAGAGDIGALAGGAGGAAALLELPGDDAVQDVGARLDTEHLIIELQVGALALAVEALNLDLHD